MGQDIQNRYKLSRTTIIGQQAFNITLNMVLSPRERTSVLDVHNMREK